MPRSGPRGCRCARRGHPRLGMPRSRAGVRALTGFVALVCALRVLDLVARHVTHDWGGDWELPQYPGDAACAHAVRVCAVSGDTRVDRRCG